MNFIKNKSDYLKLLYTIDEKIELLQMSNKNETALEYYIKLINERDELIQWAIEIENEV
jgi:hypothetical protein